MLGVKIRFPKLQTGVDYMPTKVYALFRNEAAIIQLGRFILSKEGGQ
jgi:hypothetical protein